mgnify:CR=1 FL=1
MSTEHKLHIGCHLSSSKGFLAMGHEAVKLDANTFAFFTRNPRGGRAKELDLADVEAFLHYKDEHDIGMLVAHAPYTMNACAAKENLRRFAHEAMADDLQRLEHLPGNLYNFHPGSHVGQGAEQGIALIAKQLNDVLTPDQQTTVLLETMAGKGTEVGRTFEELRAIIDRVEQGDKLGVCLDTCHVWDGGYDIREHLDEVLTEFDRVISFRASRPSISMTVRTRAAATRTATPASARARLALKRSCASSATRPSRICLHPRNAERCRRLRA